MAFLHATTAAAVGARQWFGTRPSTCDTGRRRRSAPSTTNARAAPLSSDEGSSDDVIESVLQRVENSINNIADTLLKPLQENNGVLSRQWEKVRCNYILRPRTKAAKGVVHFVGGAFLGSAPHIVYQDVLETICEEGGYVIVATAYDLSFDYVGLVEGICSNWEAVESELAAEYGALPVVGLGHSAGCVFLALGNCLFADALPRTKNVFMSFNNRRAESAIPLYAQVVQPLAALYERAEQQWLGHLLSSAEQWSMECEEKVLQSRLSPRALRTTVAPTARELGAIGQQVAPLLRETASSRREFYPPPEDVRAAISQLYAVRETVLISFENDTLDDSDELETAIATAQQQVQRVRVRGTHLTPTGVRSPLPSPPTRAALTARLARAITPNGS
ncbi:hypothetical protein BWQ96_09520 [Gracilariopsis chorda]|uniref:Uncharacterized protein n=1 Tax=Gracilariopsis chorda TaxID=448386 RepID=A0A2V3IFF4_9FLOR|nr:hypothetical protein BWQ96_09520 [Gracilariopsis chorda]|eukprot:PXF40758.1 hypothetical protein BWQ96_09520 [Gracilariopsis chorda]